MLLRHAPYRTLPWFPNARCFFFACNTFSRHALRRSTATLPIMRARARSRLLPPARLPTTRPRRTSRARARAPGPSHPRARPRPAFPPSLHRRASSSTRCGCRRPTSGSRRCADSATRRGASSCRASERRGGGGGGGLLWPQPLTQRTRRHRVLDEQGLRSAARRVVIAGCRPPTTRLGATSGAVDNNAKYLHANRRTTAMACGVAWRCVAFLLAIDECATWPARCTGGKKTRGCVCQNLRRICV